MQKGEKLKKEEPEYEFQWEEEPDTNRLFSESIRSFNRRQKFFIYSLAKSF